MLPLIVSPVFLLVVPRLTLYISDTCVCHFVDNTGLYIAIEESVTSEVSKEPAAPEVPPPDLDLSTDLAFAFMDIGPLDDFFSLMTGYDHNDANEPGFSGYQCLTTDELIHAVENSNEPLTPHTLDTLDEFLILNH